MDCGMKVQVVQHDVLLQVGDGINDAPALAAADVGVAVTGAMSDAAGATADVLLLRGDGIAGVPLLLSIAERTQAVLKQVCLHALVHFDMSTACRHSILQLVRNSEPGSCPHLSSCQYHVPASVVLPVRQAVSSLMIILNPLGQVQALRVMQIVALGPEMSVALMQLCIAELGAGCWLHSSPGLAHAAGCHTAVGGCCLPRRVHAAGGPQLPAPIACTQCTHSQHVQAAEADLQQGCESIVVWSHSTRSGVRAICHCAGKN